MKKLYWKIEGYDSSDKIYENKIPIHCIGEKQMVSVLKCLVAEAGLNFDEIVGAYATRRTRISNCLLDVKRGSLSQAPHLWFSCGDNPYFAAHFIEE